MKKLILSVSLLSLLTATPALAETSIKETVKSELDSRRAGIKDAQLKLKETAERAKTEVKDARGDVKEAKAGFRVDTAKIRATVAGRVFTATISRLEKLITRIESRVTKIETNGGVTTEAKAFIATAKTNIADAKAHIALMQSVELPTTSSTTARTNFDKIKTEAKTAKDLLVQAKQNLQKAVRSLAGWEKDHKQGATTTASAEVR